MNGRDMEAVMTYFNVIFHHLAEGTERNQEKQDVESLELRFQPGTS
jgi:hypothetical protein